MGVMGMASRGPRWVELLRLLEAAVLRSERLVIAGRLRDPWSRAELAFLRGELAALRPPDRREPGTVIGGRSRFIWSRAAAARRAAGSLRAKSATDRVLSRQLRRRARELRPTRP